MVTVRRAAYVGATTFIRATLQSGSTLSILVIAKFLGQEAVATYSTCLAAVWLCSIVLFYGTRIMMRRYLVTHPDLPAVTVYRRSQAAVFRSPLRYAVATALFAGLAVYIGATVGSAGVILLVLMAPLAVILVFLGLKIEYHKALGQAIMASLVEPGLLHLLIAALVLAAVGFGATDLIPIFAVGGGGFLVAAFLAVGFVWRQTANEPKLGTSGAEPKILATELLVFVFRNGFPLFFVAFMAAVDLGHFRTEERLFYMLLFFYMLFETLGLKAIIAVFRDGDDAEISRFYTRCVAQIFGIGAVAALVLFAGLSNHALAATIGYEWNGRLLLLMAMATPFYFVAYFNNLVLNLIGQHSAVIWSLLCGAVAFIAGAWLLYPWYGVDGVRAAYLCGGLVSSGMSGAVVLLRHRASQARPA